MEGLKICRPNLQWSLGTFLWFARPDALLVEGHILCKRIKVESWLKTGGRWMDLSDVVSDGGRRRQCELVQNSFHTFTPQITDRSSMVSSLIDGTMRVTEKMRVKRRWSILPLSGSCTDGSAATTFAVPPGVSKPLYKVAGKRTADGDDIL